MPRGHFEIINHGTRADAEAFFNSHIPALSRNTRLILYALVLSSPNIQDTIGDRVPQGAFSQRTRGSDDAYVHGVHQNNGQPAHDELPDDQQTPVGALEQMFSAPSVGSPYDPPETYAAAQSMPEQFAQPGLETIPGVSPLPVAELEQMTGMDQYDRQRMVANVAQDFPVDNAPAEQASVGQRVSYDETMAAEARRIIDEVHAGAFRALGYEELDKVPGELQRL